MEAVPGKSRCRAHRALAKRQWQYVWHASCIEFRSEDRALALTNAPCDQHREKANVKAICWHKANQFHHRVAERCNSNSAPALCCVCDSLVARGCGKYRSTANVAD